MGFIKYEPVTFFKLKDFKIVVTTNKDNLHNFQDLLSVGKAVEYKNKDGIPMIDIQLDGFEGYLQSMEAKDYEYGKSWHIAFIDENNKKYIWSISYDNLLFQSFINCLCKTEKLGLIKLSPWKGKDKKGKEQTKLTIYHNNKKLDWSYKPEELPPVLPMKDSDGEVMLDAKGNILYNKKKKMMWLLQQVELILSRIKPQEKVDYSNEEDDDNPAF